jgi:hypothetical protein
MSDLLAAHKALIEAALAYRDLDTAAYDPVASVDAFTAAVDSLFAAIDAFREAVAPVAEWLGRRLRDAL